MANELLFAKYDIYNIIASQRDRLIEAYKRLPDTEATNEEVLKRLKAEYMLDVPVLGEPYATQGTTHIDARRMPNRLFMSGTGPVMEEVTEFTICVPFIGDPSVFNIAPSAYNGIACRGEIVDHELRFRIVAVMEGFDVQSEIDRQLQQINWSLTHLREKESYASQELESGLRGAVATRKRAILSRQDAVGKLKIPIRLPTPPGQPSMLIAPVQPSGAKQKSALERRHWDVFVSHSSNDKGYVRPLVDALEAANITVWYDDKELDWGDGLRRKISEGLINSDYAIVVLSKSFLGVRKWTEHELDALFAREAMGRTIILPIWHGIERGDLLNYSPDLADRMAKISNTDDPSEIVQSVLKRLGRSAG